MNKTIFNLSYKSSIIIVSLLGIMFGFLSNAFYVNGVMDFILFAFRLILFLGVYLILFFIEKNNGEFKESTRRMLGYIGVSALLNIVCSIFVSTHLLSGLFITISGLVCFWEIMAFVIETLQLYFNNKFVGNLFMINKKIGLTLASPIIKLFNITND